MSRDLDQQAIQILLENDRGGYTVPTARLYPYQWNWDSAFVALGFAAFDRNRAWTELEMLLEGQWKNGMIPHIIFRQNDPDYFPGPSVWKVGNERFPTGGISQPPVLSSVVRTLVEAGGRDDAERARGMFSQLMAWHRWFHTDRKPKGCPVVATVHPWETGRDNCPDWESGLSGFDPDPTLEPYNRMDTSHIDPSMRPSERQYDQYISIIKFGREVGWDQKRLTNEGPFLMADPGIHFILLRADRDLLALAQRWNEVSAAKELQKWIDDGLKGSDYLWNENLSAYCARNVKTGKFAQGFSNASALSLYANAGSEKQKQATIKHIRRIVTKVKYLTPSWDPDAPLFEPQRYWCGPLWPQMNYMIAKGLQEAGETRLSEKLRFDMTAVINKSGFWECFNPINGEGCIGSNFSWTAAMWLAWASPNTNAIAA